MTRRSSPTSVRRGAFAFAIVAAAVACSSGKEKGGLMLAIDTDMKAPKDVNVIGLAITVDNVVRYSYLGRVTPQGKVLLPATVALTEPSNPDASIRIRLIAFQEQRPRVLRDVRTKVPTNGRIALLRVALKFVDDGSATGGMIPAGTAPSDEDDFDKPIGGSGAGPGSTAESIDFYAQFQSKCDVAQGLTSIDGKCQDDYVDSESLPEYHQEELGQADDPASCFDVRTAFANATTIDATLDRTTCTIDSGVPTTDQLNFAVVTSDAGTCVLDGVCYLPIDGGDGGWTIEGGRVKFPAYVCTLLSKNDAYRLARATGTATKHANNPICATKKDELPIADAGTDAGADDASIPDASDIDAGMDADRGCTLAGAFAALHVSTTLDVGTSPAQVRVNPVTGKVYVANVGDGVTASTVSVIDPANANAITSVGVGNGPGDVAVNSMTNKIYVANYGTSANPDNRVSVIDGATNGVKNVTVANNPNVLAINPATNRIYVTQYGLSGTSVGVIDAANNDTVTDVVLAHSQPEWVVVNPTTNKAYISHVDGYITVLDGANNGLTYVDNGTRMSGAGVNTVTNKIYFANFFNGPNSNTSGGTTITQLDGTDNTLSTFTVGTSPINLFVDEFRNKLYVANYDSNEFFSVDVMAAATTSLALAGNPQYVAFDPNAGWLYVTESTGSAVAVIDVVNGTLKTVTVGTNPAGVAVDPCTHRAYVANSADNTVSVIE